MVYGKNVRLSAKWWNVRARLKARRAARLVDGYYDITGEQPSRGRMMVLLQAAGVWSPGPKPPGQGSWDVEWARRASSRFQIGGDFWEPGVEKFATALEWTPGEQCPTCESLPPVAGTFRREECGTCGALMIFPTCEATTSFEVDDYGVTLTLASTS